MDTQHLDFQYSDFPLTCNTLVSLGNTLHTSNMPFISILHIANFKNTVKRNKYISLHKKINVQNWDSEICNAYTKYKLWYIIQTSRSEVWKIMSFTFPGKS